MVQIVSGIPEEQFDGGAVLRGFTNARKMRQEQEAEKRRQLSAALEIQNTKMRLDKAKADALEETNRRAELGEVQALQQQEMEAIAQGLPPDVKRLKEWTELRQHLKDPVALKMADAGFFATEKRIQLDTKFKVAEGEIERAVKDGLIDEAGAQSYMQRVQAKRQSGEAPDDILTEFSKARMDRSVKAANAQENAEALQQIDATLSAMPPGREKKLAMIVAEEFRNSPSLQEKDGAGAKVLAEIKKISVGPLSRQDEIQEATRQRAMRQPAPGLAGMTVGQRNEQMEEEPFMGMGGPEVPAFTGGTHATVKRGAAGKPNLRAVRKALPALIEQAGSPVELAKLLQAQGVPLTEEVKAEVRKALEGRKTRAQSQGGADR